MNTNLESFRTDLATTLKGMTQEELAEKSGVPQPTISNFVSGRTKAISCEKFLALYPFVYGDKPPAQTEVRS